MKKVQLYSGTSGLVLPVPNKSFYPEEFKDKSRLTYYGSLFNSIEINSSFYQLPRKQTVTKWAQSVPEDFRFTFKLWREITHQKELVFNKEDIFRFMETISGSGNKKGCLLIQFPAKISIAHLNKIYRMLQYIQRSGNAEGWSIQFEFRHHSLYDAETYQILEEFNAGVVIHDMCNFAIPPNQSESDTVYLRFHGPEKGYKGSYTDEFLIHYTGSMKALLQNNKTIYVYFNNTLGNAVNNLLTLNKMLNE